MADTVATKPPSCQANSLACRPADEDKALALLRQDLREAIEESGVKKEAVAAAMGLPDAAYLSKLFSGEKTITAKHIDGLPNDIERIFYRRRAERFGLLVVEPCDDATARRHLVSGLLNVFAPTLPRRADAMAKASLPAASVKAGVR